MCVLIIFIIEKSYLKIAICLHIIFFEEYKKRFKVNLKKIYFPSTPPLSDIYIDLY